jgi:membrane protein DedA with SNARE-associated domain
MFGVWLPPFLLFSAIGTSAWTALLAIADHALGAPLNIASNLFLVLALSIWPVRIIRWRADA